MPDRQRNLPQSSSLIRAAASPRLLLRSARIALVVGTTLNLINQGADVWAGKPLHVAHFLMNFMVPFCVSTYSAAKNEISRTR